MEDTQCKSDFTAAESALDKWLCIASEPHQLVLAKVEGNKDPVILHSFLTVQGTRKEFGFKQVKNVVLCGMTRKTQVASLNVVDLFTEKELPSFSLPTIFKTKSVETVQALTTKPKTKTSNPRTKIPPCIILPKHISLAFLETGTASGAELFLLAKEAVISKLLTMQHDDEDVPGEVEIMIDVNGTPTEYKFSSNTVMKQGGDVLSWLLASMGDEMKPLRVEIPMSGNLIQNAAANVELCRLGREPPQAAIHASTNERASIAESFENLKDILHGATDKLVEKQSGCKVQDKLFLAQLRMPASRDKETMGDLSATGMLVWKTKDLESKKSLFARQLRNKGVEDAALSAAQAKCFCVGDWHFNPTTPGGTSIHLMSAPGVDNEDVEENSRIIATKLHLKLQSKITESEFRKYSDKSVKVPSSLEEMIEVFQLHCTCFEVFLTSESILVDCYQSFISDLKEMKGRLRKKIAGDKDYIFSLMHLVDLTLNDFFEQCYRYCETPQLIDFETIELERIISKIRNHELKLDVFPNFYRQLTMTETKTMEVKGVDGAPPSKKAKKTVTNDDPNKDWSLRDGEDFKSFIEAPGRLKPGKVCLKWWMLHECDSGCRKKKSHHVLTDQQKKDMNAFVKGIRKEK